MWYYLESLLMIVRKTFSIFIGICSYQTMVKQKFLRIQKTLANKRFEIINIHKFQRSKTILSKMSTDLWKITFLWLLANYKNLSHPSYSTIKSLWNILLLTPLFKIKPFHSENSAFIDLCHDHLLTGDLRIEYVANLRKLMKCIWNKWSCRTGL